MYISTLWQQPATRTTAHGPVTQQQGAYVHSSGVTRMLWRGGACSCTCGVHSSGSKDLLASSSAHASETSCLSFNQYWPRASSDLMSVCESSRHHRYRT